MPPSDEQAPEGEPAAAAASEGKAAEPEAKEAQARERSASVPRAAPKKDGAGKPAGAGAAPASKSGTSPLLYVLAFGVVAVLAGTGYYVWSSYQPGEGELTKATWDEATTGKTVFVKFLAPW